MASAGAPSTCVECGELLEEAFERCPVCRTPTSSGGPKCAGCGRNLKGHWTECPECRTPVPNPVVAANDMFLSVQPGGLGFSLNANIPIADGGILGDRYTVERRLGMGGFGAVYLVHDGVTHDKRAIKVVVAGEEGDGSAAQQLIHEFRLRERISDSRHVLTVQDPRPTEYKGLSLVLLPMRFADGGSFRDWLQKDVEDGESRAKEGLRLFRQACDGVRAIHEAGLAHLDLKPENLLIVEGAVKVADFGIGRFMDKQFSENPDALLAQGVGTPQYMSPEQFRAARQKDVGPASDIYSLGLILYELLDGSLPFDGNPAELKEKHLNVEPTPPKGVSDPWQRVLRRALAKRPEDRYPASERLLEDVERALQGISLAANAACLECGRVNANVNAKECSHCGASVAALFRACPLCARDVRIDVDQCPGCGKAVAAYYVLQERKSLIERLKDEDLAEAVDLLEAVLRDGADDYHERAVELIRELRAKLEEVSDLVAAATEHETRGELNDAQSAWRDILNVVPRHKQARHHIDRLGDLDREYRQGLADIPELLDRGEFQQAEESLLRSESLIPARTEARDTLEECRQRAAKFTEAMNESAIVEKGMRIKLAARYAARAVEVAPKSGVAKALASRYEDILQSVQCAIDAAWDETESARFDEADARLEDVAGFCADADGIQSRQAKNQEIRGLFLGLMTTAETACTAGDLDGALEHARSALSSCPKSQRARECVASVESDRDEVGACLGRAEGSLLKSAFVVSKKAVAEAQELWSKSVAIQDFIKRMNTIKEEFIREMQSAKEYASAREWDDALAHIQASLALCPESSEALERKRFIEKTQDSAMRGLDDARSLAEHGDYRGAMEACARIEKIWPKIPGLDQATQEFWDEGERFNGHMEQANALRRVKKHGAAVRECEAALDIAEGSKEAKDLLETIRREEEREVRAREIEAQRVKEEREKRIMIGVGSALATAFLVGLVLFFAATLLSLFSVGVAAGAYVLHRKKNSETYRWVARHIPDDEWLVAASFGAAPLVPIVVFGTVAPLFMVLFVMRFGALIDIASILGFLLALFLLVSGIRNK